jgi:hypothetical protein
MRPTLLFICAIALLALVTFTGCSKPVQKGCTDPTALNYVATAEQDDGSCTYPFQGPKNPSFETDILNNNDWRVAFLGGVDYSGWAAGGTGFLPSQGSYYLQMPSNNFSSGNTAYEVYQNNVDLSRSTTMTIDYAMTGTLTGVGVASVEFLFTVNGTVSLWSKSYSAANPPTTQKLNEVIALPSLPDAGKLTIRFTVNTTLADNVHFGLDNIRVAH